MEKVPYFNARMAVGPPSSAWATAPGKTTLAGFLNRWLEDSARLNVRERTLENYRRAVNLHIAPKLGGMKIDKLTTAQVEWFYAELERGGVGCHTRRLCHAVLRLALSKAVKWKVASHNVCIDADAPRVTTKETEALTAEEVGTLLAAAVGDRLEALYVLAVTSGMRLGELFGLQWANVDLEAGSLFVRHALQESSGKLTLGEPKTAKSKRNVALPKLAVDALRGHRERQLAAMRLPTGYVFTNTEGNPLRRSHFHRQMFKPLLKAAGLPDIRFHDLLHTTATLLLRQGINAKIVSERLGHSKIGITMDLYSHVMPDMQREAAASLDRLLAVDSPNGSKVAVKPAMAVGAESRKLLA